jgi:hypothetical protein
MPAPSKRNNFAGTSLPPRAYYMAMRRALSITAWVVIALLAIFVAVTSFRYFLLPPELAAPPNLLQTLIDRRTVFLLHVGGGMTALLIGFWNFIKASRDRFLNLHRWFGRIYLVGVLTGGIAGFLLSFTAQGGIAGRIGFGMLAVLWIVTAVFAYVRIREYDLESHRRWMIRNYALTFAAVTLRLWLPLLMASGYDFREAYVTVAWLSWVPNLLVAEVIANRKMTQVRSANSSPVPPHDLAPQMSAE